MKDDITLRAAVADDIAAMTKFIFEHGANQWNFLPADDVAAHLSAIAQGKNKALLAESQGKLLGFVTFMITRSMARYQSREHVGYPHGYVGEAVVHALPGAFEPLRRAVGAGLVPRAPCEQREELEREPFDGQRRDAVRRLVLTSDANRERCHPRVAEVADLVEPDPVAAERLKKQFPNLTDDDLQAYTEVTQRLLGQAKKGRALSEIMTTAVRAREKEAAGETLAAEESLALRYLRAMEKMQG